MDNIPFILKSQYFHELEKVIVNVIVVVGAVAVTVALVVIVVVVLNLMQDIKTLRLSTKYL